MNKDTIYIEPSDDITDIISKIKESEQKVVALVPPKKLGILASAINIKLIAKTAKSTSKAVVMVTDNPSLMKLCATAELPIAETLQSRPVVPSLDDISAAEQGSGKLTIAEENDEDPEREKLASDFTAEPGSAADIFDPQEDDSELNSAEIEDELAANAAEDIEPASDDGDAASGDSELSLKSGPGKATSQSATVSKGSLGKTTPGKAADAKGVKITDADSADDSAEDEPTPEEKKAKTKKLRRRIIIVSVIVLLLGAGLFWAFAIAPAVDITVSIAASSANFSENVSFTTKQSEEDALSGKFYLETLDYKETLSAPLTATGEKDLGEKAKGEIAVGYAFKGSDFDDDSNKATVTVPAGTVFTQGGKSYATDKALILSTDIDKCEWSGTPSRCSVSGQVSITAAEAGEAYNCSAGATWGNGVFTASNTTTIAGGTSKVVKVLQQKDIETALGSLKKLNETEAKSILSDKMSKGYVLIENSYKATTGEPKVSIAVGEEVPSGAKLEQEITYSMYAVDSERIAEFIKKKADLASDQKIYKLGDPYIERFTATDSSMTGKIKTTYEFGPEITSDGVMEKVKGKKTGEAYSLLQSINGVKNVDIKTSYFWVNSVPSDPNKIHIKIEVKE